MKARVYLDVEFNEGKTDAEGIASALDKVVANGLAVLLDTWKPYGGEPKVGEFFVLDTKQAAEHAEDLDRLIDGKEDELVQCSSPSATFCGRSPGRIDHIGSVV